MSSMDILHAAFFTPRMDIGGWGLPVLWVSSPGRAKTSVMRAYAESLALPFDRKSPGITGEAGFGVVPVPYNNAAGELRLANPAHDWTDPFEKENRGFLLIDEVTTADRQLQPYMLCLLDERRIGNYRLPGGVRVMGACNPASSAANGNDLSAANANRFMWIEWSTPRDMRQGYMLNRTPNVAPKSVKAEEAAVVKAWPEAYARAVGIEQAFEGAHEDWINREPKASDPKASGAWPSERTWDYLVHALASSAIHGLTDNDRYDFCAGAVGKEAAEAFFTFMECVDLPDTAAVLDGKLKWKPEMARLDRTAAVFASATALVSPKNADRRKERGAALWRLLADVSTEAREVVVPFIQTLTQAGVVDISDNVQKKLLAQLKPVINAAVNAGGVA